MIAVCIKCDERYGFWYLNHDNPHTFIFKYTKSINSRLRCRYVYMNATQINTIWGQPTKRNKQKATHSKNKNKNSKKQAKHKQNKHARATNQRWREWEKDAYHANALAALREISSSFRKEKEKRAQQTENWRLIWIAFSSTRCSKQAPNLTLYL